jgi:hypothetical protein
VTASEGREQELPTQSGQQAVEIGSHEAVVGATPR